MQSKGALEGTPSQIRTCDFLCAGRIVVQQHKSDNRDRAPLAGFEVGRCGEHSSASREFAKGGYSYDVRRNKKVVLWIKKRGTIQRGYGYDVRMSNE